FSLELLIAGIAFAISFFSASTSTFSFSVFSRVGFTIGDGFGEALARTNFLGEGVRAGLAVGVGFGVGLGVGFGVVFAFGVAVGLGLRAGVALCAGFGEGFGVGS